MAILNARGTSAYNLGNTRAFPVVMEAGALAGTSDWSAATGLGAAVATDSFLYYVESTILKKMDPETGSVVASRDFSPNAIGIFLGGGTVGGVDRIYVLKDPTSAASVVHAVKTTDLTDIWTQDYTGNTLGIKDSTFCPYDTTSGLLVCGVDNGSPYKLRAIKDNGATASYFWTSDNTGDLSFGCTSYPGASRIFRSNPNAIAVSVADGTTAYNVAGANFAGGIAPSILGTTLGFGRSGASPYDIAKITLSDGVADSPLANPFSGGAIATEPGIDSSGYLYIWSGTFLKCYDASFNLQWTYTHFETIAALALDSERRLYISSASKIQCYNASRVLQWEVSYSGGVAHALFQLSSTRLIAMKSGAALGIALTTTSTFDRVLPIQWRVQLVSDRQMPTQYSSLFSIERQFNLLYDLGQMLRISRSFPINYVTGRAIDKKFPIYLQGPHEIKSDREFVILFQASLNVDRIFPLHFASSPSADVWQKEQALEDQWLTGKVFQEDAFQEDAFSTSLELALDEWIKSESTASEWAKI